MIKRLVRVLGILCCLGVFAVGVAASMASVTPWTLLYLLGVFLVFLGAVLPGRLRLVSPGGLALVVLVGAIRLAVVPATVIVLPEGTPSRLSALVEERDLTLMATRWGGPLHLLPRPELREVGKAMRAAYREMSAAHGLTASPVLDTFLGRNSSKRFDAVVFESGSKPTGALIYLHGFTGNSTPNCGLAARAAREAGMMTVCPSADFHGRWWEGEGAATFQNTLRWVESKGIRRIVLGGLSNGANGASALAPTVEGHLAGLLLVSGGLPESRPVPVPVLAIHGKRDSMVNIQQTRKYMAQYPPGPFAELVETPDGHFTLLSKREDLGRQISRWLQVLVSPPPPQAKP